MPSLAFTPDTIIGRRVDLLGRVQPVALGSASAGTVTTIFQTDDTDFRGKTIFVGYVTVELVTVSSPAPGVTAYTVSTDKFVANQLLDIGSNGSKDWFGNASIDISSLGSPLTICTWPDAAGILPMVFQPFVYGPQINFTVTNRAIGASTQLVRVSAYGWAYG